MAGLAARDLEAVLETARELAAVPDGEEFRARILPRLRRLVAYDLASLNEISPHTGEALITATSPDATDVGEGAEVFAAYAHQNPLVAAAQRLGPTPVLKFSDLITRRQLHRLELYDLIYGPLGVEHQIAVVLPAPSGRVVGIALNRARRDFSERDRTVLEAVRPFVAHAYEQLAARALAQATVAALGDAVDASASAVIVLHTSGEIEFASDAAARWIAALGPADRPSCLPEPLASWSELQRRRARAMVPLDARLEIDIGVDVLSARFVPGARGGLDVLLIEPRGGIDHALLRALGLTNREREVIAHVARGLANAAIAVELSLSERTVAKHLEHIYAKLGVTNRAAAVTHARNHSVNPADSL